MSDTKTTTDFLCDRCKKRDVCPFIVEDIISECMLHRLFLIYGMSKVDNP